MKYCEKSIRDVKSTNAEIIRGIYDRMMVTRKKAEVEYRPLTQFDHMNVIYNSGVDFRKLYPEANVGDYVFVTYFTDGIYEKDMNINIIKNKSCEVYFNGEKKEVKEIINRGQVNYAAEVRLKEGKNLVIVKVPAEEECFTASIRTFIPGLNTGADGYGYNTRPYIECEGYNGVECMRYSRLYKKEETPEVSLETIDWVFPVMPKQSSVKEFDFISLCNGIGRAAYPGNQIKTEKTDKSPVDTADNGKKQCNFIK